MYLKFREKYACVHIVSFNLSTCFWRENTNRSFFQPNLSPNVNFLKNVFLTQHFFSNQCFVVHVENFLTLCSISLPPQFLCKHSLFENSSSMGRFQHHLFFSPAPRCVSLTLLVIERFASLDFRFLENFMSIFGGKNSKQFKLQNFIRFIKSELLGPPKFNAVMQANPTVICTLASQKR